MKHAKLIVPTLDQITIKQYQEIESCKELNGESTFTQQKVVSIVYGLTLNQVKEIDQFTIQSIYTEITNLLMSEVDFKQTFIFNGINYGFIPNLKSISSGEYADLETHLQKPETYHNAMAVMFRPITQQVKDKYNTEKYEGTSETAEACRLMPLSYFIGAMVFFCSLEKELFQCTQTFIEKQSKQMSQTFQQEADTQKNGDGILPLTELLTEILKESNMQQRQLFTKS